MIHRCVESFVVKLIADQDDINLLFNQFVDVSSHGSLIKCLASNDLETLQNYTYDPSVVDCLSLNINEDDDEEQIQNAATLAAEQDKIILNEKNKQLKLTDLWKK
ncbi:unnamed protein product [Rotaria socialis]|uniref:Uncharacterized protein n=1 Tax=Rotaria socialis TaxID=392032 RepID=A0A817RYD9_9BILA|nr:unnamed protein product [Rotaria socialis]